MPKNVHSHPSNQTAELDTGSKQVHINTDDLPANDLNNTAERRAGNTDSACLALLSTRALSRLIPGAQIEEETERAIARLEAALVKTEKQQADSKGSSQRLLDRVAFASRGKRLNPRADNLAENVAVVSKSILIGKCLIGQYNLRSRELHPYGVVIKEPKVYLLAAESTQSDENSSQACEPLIKHYLLNRFDSLNISIKDNRVPQSFSVQEYLDNGMMEIRVPELEEVLPEKFELVLRVHGTDNTALIRDLQEFTLDKQQSAVIRGCEDGSYLLTVPNQSATYELIEWLMARTNRVEVLEPDAMREHILDCAFETFDMYYTNPSPLTAEELKSMGRHDEATSLNQLAVEKSDNYGDVKLTKFATDNKDNTLVASLVLKILKEVKIDNQLLERDEMLAINAMFDDELRTFIDNKDIPGFKERVDSMNTLYKDADCDFEDPFLVNIEKTSKQLGLSDVETGVLAIAALLKVSDTLNQAIRLMCRKPSEHHANVILASLLETTQIEVFNASHETAKLRRTNMIFTMGYGVNSVSGYIDISNRLSASLFTHNENPLGIMAEYARRSPEPGIDAEDLDHLGNSVSIALQYLFGANKQKTKGCNILLWGSAGTGKTQLARYLAKTLYLDSYELKTNSLSGAPLAEKDILSAYTIIQTYLEGAGDSLVVFDEVENIIDSRGNYSEGLSKASLNHILENNTVPTIWISNSVDSVDPAYLRRFDVAIYIPVPEIKAKKRMAERILNDIPINGELLNEFLERKEIGPAFLTKVKRVVDLAELTTEQHITEIATNLLQEELLINNRAPAKLSYLEDISDSTIKTLPYDFSLINASEDLGALAQTLTPGVNAKFCLYGPPGTGKTAWAKKLAEQLKMPDHVIQVSDILGSYVGDTENNIARAFNRAEDQQAVLIFDEVDTFLQSRNTADRGYEKRSTNQFLTSLENHNGLVVCSTNLMDTLDTAVLRRFDFKVKFNYLTAAQANQLLVSTATLLGMQLTVQDIISRNCGMKGDTYAPGDFAVVLKRNQIFTHEVTLEKVVADLKAEAEIRNGCEGGRSMGFL